MPGRLQNSDPKYARFRWRRCQPCIHYAAFAGSQFRRPPSPEHDVVPHTSPPRTTASTRRCRRSGMPPKLEDEWLSLAQRFEQFGHGSWVVENGSVTEVLGPEGRERLHSRYFHLKWS